MKRKTIFITLIAMLALTALIFPSCEKETDDASPTSTFTDSRDGQTYNTIKIGNQTWMAENLAYLPQIDNNSTFASATDARYGVYGYDGTDVTTAKNEDNYSTYGVLYNWYAAMAGAASSAASPSGVQGICPNGWHLPSYEEWIELERALSGENKGSQLANNTNLWGDGVLKDATSDFGTSDFAALPAGFRDNLFGAFFSVGTQSLFWSSTESSNGRSAWVCNLIIDRSSVSRGDNAVKSHGFSVRCVKD